ncbi:serine/threonine protein kinase [Nostoc sp. UIC 10890]
MPWTTGQRLQGGRYVIDKVLGQGGFGITYKALHVELNRTVVIKTPNEYLSHDPEYDKYIERFIREGQILARLSEHLSSHIVGVIELFAEANTHCLVMDFVPGENLFEAVKRTGALPEAEIVPCIRQIGEALMVVHQAGLVHRDAHPGNIMLRNNGKAVLIDFGIAKELVPKTLSSTGNAGNHGFAPYEQITRGSREPTVDVYCLAATIYYAMTGQSPTPSLARKLHNASLKQPKQIIPSISKRLNQAILKGMALEAKDRPQSMKAWLAMLDAPKVGIKEVGDLRKNKILARQSISRKIQNFIGTLLNRESLLPFKLKLNPDKLARIIPWCWWVGVLLSYLLIGYLLAAFNHLYVVWIAVVAGAVGAVAGAGVVAWAKAVPKDVAQAWADAWDGALPVVLGVPVAIAIAVLMLVVLAVVVGVPVAIAVAVAGEKLRKSFSKFHTFLILASTSSLGLGLGWLGHRIFNIGT